MFNKRLKYGYFLFVLLSVVFSSGCNKEENNDIPLIDYNYFPDDIGHWIIYEIEEIQIDAPSEVYDTSRYQIKEIIASEFLDNSNRVTLRIERYIRENDTTSWEIKDVWYANLLTSSAQKVEENIRYVKLSFPVALHKSWDGNAYNTYDEQEYEITAIDTSETINDIFIDSVLTVTQRDWESLIDKYYSVEKYAKNIGIVYKNYINIELALTDTSLPIEDRIITGSLYTQKITGYGLNQ